MTGNPETERTKQLEVKIAENAPALTVPRRFTGSPGIGAKVTIRCPTKQTKSPSGYF
jgi:hypothetical protein